MIQAARTTNKITAVILLMGLIGFGVTQHFGVIAQTTTVTTSTPSIVIDSTSDINSITPVDGSIVIIRTGAGSGVFSYDKDSSSTADGTDVINGPNSIGRLLKISGGSAVDSSNVLVVDNVAAFATTSSTEGKLFITRGYSTAGIGTGIYRYHATGRPTADGVLYFDAAGADDYLELLHNGVIDVTQAGAVAGGTASTNVSAIQRAIDASLAASNQSSYTAFSANQAPTIHFPRGIYDINETLSIGGNSSDWFSSIKFTGEGPRRSVLRAASGTTDSTMPFMLDFDPVDPGTLDNNSFWEIRDLGFEGVNPWTSSSITAIDCKKSAYWKIENCFFRYFDKAIEMRNWSNHFVSNRVEYCTTGIYFSEEDGIDGQQTINDNIIALNSFGNVGYGVVTARSLPINFITITQNQFDGDSYAAILFNGPVEKFDISRNYFERAGRVGAATIQTNNSGSTTTVNGAIVMHPTTNNTSGANGSIEDNFFINCNLTSTMSISGSRQLEIVKNRIAGSAVTSFVTFENASGITAGPLPYTSTQRIFVEQSKKDASNSTAILTRIVNVKITDYLVANSTARLALTGVRVGSTVRQSDNGLIYTFNGPAGGESTSGNWSAGATQTSSNTNGNSHIVARDTSGYRPQAFVTSDIFQATNQGTGFVSKGLWSDGLPVITHVTASGTCNYRFTIPVTPNSPLSGSLIRFAGQAMGDDGTAEWTATITDGLATDVMISASYSAGAWASSRNNTYFISPQASGSRNITIDIKSNTSSAATTQYLKGFAICDASFEMQQEPLQSASNSTPIVSTATDGDTTPTVDGIDVLIFDNTSSETITDLDDGYNGKQIECHLDSNTTLDDTAGNFSFASALSGSITGPSSISLRLIEGVWTQTSDAVAF